MLHLVPGMSWDENLLLNGTADYASNSVIMVEAVQCVLTGCLWFILS